MKLLLALKLGHQTERHWEKKLADLRGQRWGGWRVHLMVSLLGLMKDTEWAPEMGWMSTRTMVGTPLGEDRDEGSVATLAHQKAAERAVLLVG